MPIPVVCPGCAVKLNAPDAASGQRLKCPKCQAAITVPKPEPEPQFEVVEDAPAPKPAAKPKAVARLEQDEPKPKKPSKAVVELDDEEEAAPKPKKKAKAVADDEDDRPRKKKRRDEDDEDEDDERPRKKKKKAAGGANLIRNVVGAVVLVVLLVVAAFVYWDKFGAKKEEAASSSTNNGEPSVTTPANNNPPPGPAVNSAKVTQAARALTGWRDAVNGVVDALNRAVDGESARRAAQDVEQSATRVQQLAAELKAVGTLTGAEQAAVQASISADELKQAEQSYASAKRGLGRRLGAFGTVAAIQAILNAVVKLEAANYAFRDAVRHAGGAPPASGAFAPSGMAAYVLVRHLAVSADGKSIAANGMALGNGQFTPALRVWPLAGGAPREFRDPVVRPDDPIALSPDGKTVAAFSYFPAGKNEAVVTMWSTATGDVIRRAKAPFSDGLPTSIGFTADGSAVVAVSNGSIVTAAVAADRVEVKRPPGVLNGREVFVPGLNRVAGAVEGGKSGHVDLSLWDPAAEGAPTSIPLGPVKNGPGEFAVSADGTVAAVCSATRSDAERSRVSLYALPGGKKLGDLPDDEDPKCVRFRKVVLSPDGQFVAAVGGGPGFSSVAVFRVSDMKRIARRTGAESLSGVEFADAPRFSADGEAVYYVQSGNRLARIDTATGQETFP